MPITKDGAVVAFAPVNKILTGPLTLASDAVLRAGLAMLYHVAIYVRALTQDPDRMTADQLLEIHQLMDAIHTVPETLIQYGEWSNLETMREAFHHFDFLNPEGKFKLAEAFEECLASVREHEAKNH